jgi:hypothetical protein
MGKITSYQKSVASLDTLYRIQRETLYTSHEVQFNQAFAQEVRSTLKVLTNEKRGGLKVIAFARSSFTPFSWRFSNKLVQAQSCKRPKTTHVNPVFCHLKIIINYK